MYSNHTAHSCQGFLTTCPHDTLIHSPVVSIDADKADDPNKQRLGPRRLDHHDASCKQVWLGFAAIVRE